MNCQLFRNVMTALHWGWLLPVGKSSVPHIMTSTAFFFPYFWWGMHAVYIYTMWFFRFNFPSQYSIKVAVFKLFASTFCKKNLDWDMWGITLLQTSNTVVHAPSCMRSIAWWSSAWQHCDVIRRRAFPTHLCWSQCHLHVFGFEDLIPSWANKF